LGKKKKKTAKRCAKAKAGRTVMGPRTHRLNVKLALTFNVGKKRKETREERGNN